MTDTNTTANQPANEYVTTALINAFNDLYTEAVRKNDYHACNLIREEVRKLVSNDGPAFKLYSENAPIPFKLI